MDVCPKRTKASPITLLGGKTVHGLAGLNAFAAQANVVAAGLRHGGSVVVAMLSRRKPFAVVPYLVWSPAHRTRVDFTVALPGAPGIRGRFCVHADKGELTQPQLVSPLTTRMRALIADAWAHMHVCDVSLHEHDCRSA